MSEKRVVISEMDEVEICYPRKIPFHPPEIYPELSALSMRIETDPENHVYETVRNAFLLMRLDAENIGGTAWNPLKKWIAAGDTVVIKPNFVLDKNPNDRTSQSTVTHGSVIRAVMDYALLALQGHGKIIVADAPQMDCDFERLTKKNGIQAVIAYYKDALLDTDITVDLIDLRQERTIYEHGVVWERIPLKGDPLGYTLVDLKGESEFKGMDPRNFYGADYNRKETIAAHSGGHNKYLISNTVLTADVVISMPKLKVHRKVGATLNLKNMVGINGNKNYLVHYQVGPQCRGGDEFSADTKQALFDRKVSDMTIGANWQYGKYLYAAYLKGKEVFEIHADGVQHCAGDWWGNDTTWRMAVDLNKILLYTDKKGRLTRNRRKYFSVIDGIIGGEGEGPLHPRLVRSGVIIMGENPVAVDAAAVAYMGLDYKKLKSLNLDVQGSMRLMDGTFEEVEIVDGDGCFPKGIDQVRSKHKYKVPAGWSGYL